MGRKMVMSWGIIARTKGKVQIKKKIKCKRCENIFFSQSLNVKQYYCPECYRGIKDGNI